MGALLGCGGVLVLIFAANYFVFMLGFIVVGIGAAFASGADMALFYDSIKAAGWEGRAQPLLARALAIENVGMVSGMLLTGLIVSKTGLVGSFWGSAASLLTAAVIALTFVEPIVARNLPSPSQTTTFRGKSRDYFGRPQRDRPDYHPQPRTRRAAHCLRRDDARPLLDGASFCGTLPHLTRLLLLPTWVSLHVLLLCDVALHAWLSPYSSVGSGAANAPRSSLSA